MTRGGYAALAVYLDRWKSVVRVLDATDVGLNVSGFVLEWRSHRSNFIEVDPEQPTRPRVFASTGVVAARLGLVDAFGDTEADVREGELWGRSFAEQKPTAPPHVASRSSLKGLTGHVVVSA